MKKQWIRLMALVLVLGLLAGCGADQASSDPSSDKTLPDEIYEGRFTFTPPESPSINMPSYDPDYGDDDRPTTNTPPADVNIESYTLQSGSTVSNSSGNIRYVMIYNPNVYDENYPYSSSRLSTGSLGTQVEVDLNRGGLEEAAENLTLSQSDLNEALPEVEIAGSKAGIYITPYKVGDVKLFYCYDDVDTNNPRISRNFVCQYAGTYCNVWVSDNSLNSTIAKEYGKEFDTYIYEAVVAAFGEARFADNGGKVNLLYYPLQPGLGGCFSTADIYASDELTYEHIFTYGFNPDHAILHINANMANYNVYPQYKTFMRSVMAHEFQHLICASAALETPTWTLADTWINEAMSGYIEELLYPGVKEDSSGHMTSFRQSDLIRSGQSLYNFTTTAEDVGVYGSVYLYSTYLADLAGDDVFSNFHDYWRTSYSYTLSVPEALANSVPQEVYYAVDQSINYPSSLTFYSDEEEWMSKLTLQFYLELLDKDAADPVSFGEVYGTNLLYNEINAATIEGGGRIIVALSGSSYTIPKDADYGLIYVGLDKDFNVVTPLIYG